MMDLEFLIDGKAFDMDRVDFTPKLGTVEHWQLLNETGMDHPMGFLAQRPKRYIPDQKAFCFNGQEVC